jgi:hypothetical protein
MNAETSPLQAGYFAPRFCGAVSGRISAFPRAATHILETYINATTGILRPLRGNPGTLHGIGRRLAGSRETIHPGLWTTKNGPKSGLFFMGFELEENRVRP